MYYIYRLSNLSVGESYLFRGLSAMVRVLLNTFVTMHDIERHRRCVHSSFCGVLNESWEIQFVQWLFYLVI